MIKEIEDKIAERYDGSFAGQMQIYAEIFGYQLASAENKLLQGKVDFYRETTDKVREYLHHNDIGEPCQPLYDAIMDKFNSQQSEIEELRRENEFNKGKVKLMSNAFEVEVEICKGFRELLEEKEKENEKELESMSKTMDYWFNRCFQAEEFINEMDYQGEMNAEQTEAYNKWKQSKIKTT